jgi:hypothetical protein
VFQPQSNKKKEERGKGKRRKKEEKEGRESSERREKKGKKIHFISPNQQVFPPGYPRMANTIAAGGCRQNEHASTLGYLLEYLRKVTTMFCCVGMTV